MLVDAIHAATLKELSETGYAGLSVERVAKRARTSKAAIYRRWPARADLVAAAIRHGVEHDEQTRSTPRPFASVWCAAGNR